MIWFRVLMLAYLYFHSIFFVGGWMHIGFVLKSRYIQRKQLPVHLISDPILTDPSTFSPIDSDLNRLSTLLNAVGDSLTTNFGAACNIVSKELEFLLSRNVPLITSKLLDFEGAANIGKNFHQGYAFVIDFLEAVSNSTSKFVSNAQETLRLILEAAKISDDAVENIFTANASNVTDPEFLVYLDSEIERTKSTPELHSILITVKLRALDEVGKKMGVPIQSLPAIISESDPEIMKKMTLAVLEKTSQEGRSVFLTALELMQSEMKKNYQRVDPRMLDNLAEVERITRTTCLDSG